MKNLCVILLIIVTLGTANAQSLRLPEHIKLTPVQHKELFTYFENAPLLEKFYLMTSIPHEITVEQAEYVNQNFKNRSHIGVYISVDELQKIRDTIFTADYLMRELKYLKMLKNKQMDLTDSDCKIIDDKINYRNGYIESLAIPGPLGDTKFYSTSRVLTYWKYGDNSYIIGTNYHLFMSSIEGETYSVPTMYRYQNDTLTQVSLSEIVKPNYPDKYGFSAECRWYDLFTPDEYLEAETEPSPKSDAQTIELGKL